MRRYALGSAEEGVVDSWNCLGGPANLPPAITARFADLVTEALRNPAMRNRYAELRMIPPPDTTPAFAAQYIRDQIAMWAPVVRESGMRVD